MSASQQLQIREVHSSSASSVSTFHLSLSPILHTLQTISFQQQQKNFFPLMEDFRSKSYGDGRMQMEEYGGGLPPALHDLRCYSTSYASAQPTQLQKEMKFKKEKGSSSSRWSLNDPELQRKKRVASYKVYAVEGKMKGSLRKSFRWLKDKYTQILYGLW